MARTEHHVHNDTHVHHNNTHGPEFNRAKPALWKSMFESFLFLQQGTEPTEETKYHLCLATLPVDVLNRIDSFLISPPTTNQYTALTELLLKLYQPSEHQNSKSLLLLPMLGDQKPSDFLNTMIALVIPGMVETMLFRTLYITKLPPYLQEHLKWVGEAVPIRELADTADKFYRVKDPNPPPPPPAPLINAIKPKPKREARKQSFIADPDSSLCWYHQKFGAKATKCWAPCTFHAASGNSEAGRQ